MGTTVGPADANSSAAIEAIPLPDAAVDVVISNCVVNLTPDKPAVLPRCSGSCAPAATSASPTSSPRIA